MFYKKIIINKYKAITDVEINFKNDLIPIIGINESGKSTLLHSILAFDSYNDDFLNGSHLNAKNRYDYESTGHKVTSYIGITNQSDIDSIQRNLHLARASKTLQQLQVIYDKKTEIIISRDLDTKIYKLCNINCDKETEAKLIDEILTSIPYILFFDDFNDRVPDSIVFPSEYTNDTYKKSEDDLRNEWNSFIEEIFLRATNEDLKTFLLNKNKNDRDGILSDVNDTLDNDIIQNWKKLKILKKELSNENINDLRLSLDYNFDQTNHEFIFKVIDKNFKGKARFFSVTERSKGFQWFFNFAIKLKYNPKYVEDYGGAIYLLDEPGSYLHSSAQEELLKSIKEISETNKVIYCTHSQYLLNPDIINLSSIKIAVRENGNIKFQNFGEYEETRKYQGALSPVYDALHLNIAKHSFPRNEKVLITEGIIDYYLLKLAIENNIFSNSLNIQIIPGTGVTNLKELISLSIAWTEKYSVLFDSDDKGREFYSKYNEFFGESESQKWLLLSLPNKVSNVKIEDLFCKQDEARLKTIIKVKNLKKAIPILYFASKEIKKDFFSSLSKETLQNFEHLESVLSKIF